MWSPPGSTRCPYDAEARWRDATPHSVIDYTKAGNLRALALTDSAALICLANDLGYIVSDHYGMVEISHLTTRHALLDFHVGWQS